MKRALFAGGAVVAMTVGACGAGLGRDPRRAHARRRHRPRAPPTSGSPRTGTVVGLSVGHADDGCRCRLLREGHRCRRDVGVIDSGVDLTHGDLTGHIDVGSSCSFIYSDTPTADPKEIANGDCSNKAAVQDLQGHGTHVATTIAGRINGVGIGGVAPNATSSSSRRAPSPATASPTPSPPLSATPVTSASTW